MTVSVPEQLVFAYSGDGSTQIFAYPVRFMDDTELTVVLEDADGVQTIQTLSTHYTASDAGEANGGSVTMLTAPATGEKLYIFRATAAKQIVDLADGQRAPAQSTEDQLDRFAMALQDHAATLARSVKKRVGSDLAGEVDLPDPEADKIVGWNASGNALENKTPGNLGVTEIITDTGLAGGSNNNVPSTSAAKAYADTKVAKAATDASSFGFVAGKDATPADTSKVLPTVERVEDYVNTATAAAQLVATLSDQAPTWTGLHKFTTDDGGIEMSGVPNISKSFAGDTPNFSFYQTATAASDTVPEYGAHFGIVSDVGEANPITAHKVALSNDATAQAGSAGVWAQTSVVNLDAGADAVYGVGHEIDINVRNAAYSTNGAPYATNLFLAGTTDASTHYATAAIVMAYGGGVDPLWNYGILGADYTTANAFKTAFISDQSKSPTILHSDTAHGKGIDFSGATFTGSAFSSPGFIVDAAGDILAATAMFGPGPGRQSTIHAYNSAASLQIGVRVENDNAGAGVAAVGLQVAAYTTSAETRSAKAGIGLVRGASNGRGALTLFNRFTDDANDFAASDVVASIDGTTTKLMIGSVLKTLSVDGSGFVKAA